MSTVWRIDSNYGSSGRIIDIFKSYNIAFAGESEGEINQVQVNDVIAIAEGFKIVAIGSVIEKKRLSILLKKEEVEKFGDEIALKLDPLFWLAADKQLHYPYRARFCKAGSDYSKLIIDIFEIENSKYQNNKMINELKQLLTNNKQIVLTGAPGTGKTYLAKQLAKSIVDPDDKLTEKETKDRLGFVQFHPAYDYTDFVEGLKPVIDSTVDQGQIAFEVRDGTFMRFCKESKKHEGPCVFIIDEINRADLSRVFGELFYALEPDYRGPAGTVTTQYQLSRKEGDREPFFVPKNVYIIGTMNDIDRSVESIDFALRRRFAWYEVKADEARFDAVITGLQVSTMIIDEAKKRYSSLNKAIGAPDGLGSSYQIGPSYFRKLKDYVTVEQVEWEDFWKYHLELLVREYVRGRSDEQDLIVKFKNAYNLIQNPST